MDEVRQLKKELASGKAGEHAESFQFAGEGPKTNVGDYNSVRAAVRDITRRLNVAIDDVIERIDSLLAERGEIGQRAEAGDRRRQIVGR